MYSAWVPLNLQLSQPASDSDYTQMITASALTATVLNQGAVNVYVNVTGSGGAAIALAQDYSIFPTFTTGSIYLDAFGTAGYEISSNQYVDSVRYVIIPAKVAVTNANGTVQTYTAQQLKEMNYSSLSKTLGIPTQGSSFKNN
jgi:hypothetical protein